MTTFNKNTIEPLKEVKRERAGSEEIVRNE